MELQPLKAAGDLIFFRLGSGLSCTHLEITSILLHPTASDPPTGAGAGCDASHTTKVPAAFALVLDFGDSLILNRPVSRHKPSQNAPQEGHPRSPGEHLPRSLRPRWYEPPYLRKFLASKLRRANVNLQQASSSLALPVSSLPSTIPSSTSLISGSSRLHHLPREINATALRKPREKFED